MEDLLYLVSDSRCKEEGRITDYAHQKLLDELYAYRSTAATLTIYDWVSIPLVYTQVTGLLDVQCRLSTVTFTR